MLWTTVKFQPMADEFVAELCGDLGLQALDLGAAEFNHLAGLRIDEMVVMLAGARLIARPAVQERVAFDDAFLLYRFTVR